MKVRVHGRCLFFMQYTDREIKWVRDRLMWWTRAEKSVRDIAQGDWVQISQGNHRKRGKIARVKQVWPEKVMVEFEDGTFLEFKPYHLIMMEQESLVYTTKEGKLYTFDGLLKLLQQEAQFEIKLENPPVKDYERVVVDPNVLPGITLEDFQCAGVSKGLTVKRGLEIVPTGGGKTEIMLAILRMFEDMGKLQRGLVVVPTVALADQFVERGRKRGFDAALLGAVHGTEKNYRSKIVVAVLNSLVTGVFQNNPLVMELLKDINAVLWDECHHLRSNSALQIALKTQHVELMLGFSGSPFLLTQPFENVGDTIIWGLTGGPIYMVPHEYVRKLGLTAEPVIFMKPCGEKMLKYAGRFQNIYDTFIIKNQTRNKEIERYTRRFVKHGFSVLILVQRIAHAQKLMEMMPDLKILCVFGGKTGVYRDLETGELIEVRIDYDHIRAEFDRREWDIIIGSTVMDEGIDIPSIGAVIAAGAGKSRIKILQRLGRGLRRKKDGLNRVYVLDFYDRGHVFLASHSRKRLEMYQEVKALIIEDERQFNNMFTIYGKELASLRATNETLTS